MNESKIAVRYAKALFQASLESNEAERIMRDLLYIRQAFAISDFREMLVSPVVKTSGKTRVFDDLFAKEVSPLCMSFLHLILENKREMHIEAMIRYFSRLYKEHKGVLAAELIIAKPLAGAEREKVHKLLEKLWKAKIEIEEKIKPELIGGFILKVEDEQYDASVSTALAKIQKTLLKQTTDK